MHTHASIQAVYISLQAIERRLRGLYLMSSHLDPLASLGSTGIQVGFKWASSWLHWASSGLHWASSGNP